MENKFDDIRPYYDEEIPAAMQRIANSDVFPLLASFVYPDEPIENVRSRVASFKTIRDFQHDTMYKVNEQIIARSTDGFTCSGIERLSPDKSYLYVSNHRDIMLDSSLLQYFLVSKGFETTEITFGANLMSHPVVIDVGKSNKMFKVERPGGSIRDFYRGSLHLSEYIRQVIKEKHQSVWIAQRNGRTKDGIDATDQGIIKMFCLSEPHDKIKAIADLHIVPVSVSYEWESCDILKTLELYQSQFMKYVKKPGEDLNSILTGILQPKGRVHFQLCPIIKKEELQQFDNCTNNEYHKNVAKLIDTRILKAYKLWPNNFIAYDMLYGQQRFKSEYTEAEKITFEKHLCKLDCYEDCLDNLKDILLGIYANPVRNSMK